MNRRYPAPIALALAVFLALTVSPLISHGAAEAGATVRNDFGPDVGLGANMCRGACGGGCPKSCEIVVSYECTGAAQLRRVEAFTCGTHKGCREHDDCLDACLRDNSGSKDCQPQCDASALEVYGASAASWLLGKGPFDGMTTFEYTRRSPASPEPAYRCPEDASRECGASTGCITAAGKPMDPVFDTYPTAGGGGMRISRLQTGPLCAGGGDRVCGHTATIHVTGTDACPGGKCTRFGMEFDYRGADPSAPLRCATSTRGEEDFVGDLIKLGGDAVAERNATTGGPAEDDGMGQLMDAFAKVIASGDSAEDVEVTITPMDEHGRPIESQSVGSAPQNGPPPIPRTIAIPAASGHLFVPMYQLADNSKVGSVKERRVTCTHKGEPVLETVFTLHAELGPDATPAEREVARLRKQAEGMEKMIEKSAAEQQSFREEADALEAELGL
jgi:hypothetical protein